MAGSLFDYSDPQTMALLGALQGLGQASAPSRLPVTGGMVFGNLAGGLMSGAEQGAKMRAADTSQMSDAAKAQNDLLNLNLMQAGLSGFGMNPSSPADLMHNKYQQLNLNMPNPGLPAAAPGSMAPNGGFDPATAPFPTAQNGGNAPPLRFADANGNPVSSPSAGDPLAVLKKSIWNLESGGSLNPPDSKAGAVGPMQIMPETGKQYGATLDQLRDPATNLAVGGRILTDLYGRYGGDPTATAVAYNAGPGVADKWIAGGRDPSLLPKETQRYVAGLHSQMGMMASAPGVQTAGAPGAPVGTPANAPGAMAPAAPGNGMVPNLQQNPDLLRAMIYQRMGFNIPGVTEMAIAQSQPPGPGRDIAIATAQKNAGIAMFKGGERPNAPLLRFNPVTNSYDVMTPQGYNQAVHERAAAEAGGKAEYEPEKIIDPVTGAQFVVPRTALQSGAQLPTALSPAAESFQRAFGEARLEPHTFYGPHGEELQGTRADLLNMPLAFGGLPPTPLTGTAAPVPPSMVAGGALPAVNPQAVRSGVAAAVPTQRPEAAAPAFPVPTPSGPKDISTVSVDDLFPGGQGIPARPMPPPGFSYGKPTTGQEEIQKDDAAQVEGFNKEAQGNQKIYQDLAHIRDIIQTGYNTGFGADWKAAFGKIYLGATGHALSGDWDPTKPGVFDKAATDLVFAAVKKLAGQVRVAEITGYQKANPALALTPQANMSIINDVLSNGKWEDARANLAGQYMQRFPGAPLSAFNAKYSQVAPLVDVTKHYQQAIVASGGKIPDFPEFEGGSQPGGAASKPHPGATDTRTLNGQTYDKVGNYWYPR